MVSQNTLFGDIFANFTNFVLFRESLSREKLAIVHLWKFLSQSFSYFSISISCIIKRHVSKKLFSNISWFAKVYLAKYFTLLNSRKSIQKSLIFSIVKVSLIKGTWKLKNWILWKLILFMFLTSFQYLLKNT